MTNQAYARSAAGMFDTINRRLTSVERRLPPPSYVPPPPPQYSGTTAARNTYYGVPSNDTERVALANSSPIWFNTTEGWDESYYAVTGLSGLTAPGLRAGTASGWYPVGAGPYVSLVASSNQSIGPGNTFTSWTAPGTGSSRRRGGTAWFTYSSGILTAVTAGAYRLGVRLMHEDGSGVQEYGVYRNNTEYIGSYARELTVGAWSRSDVILDAFVVAASANFRVKGTLGTAFMGMGGDGTLLGNEFALTYTGPALVSN